MPQRRENVIAEKADAFTDRIVKLSRYIAHTKYEYTMTNQILRSGTSIGANVAESKFAQSRADFTSKLCIALKEANETKYWIDKLFKGDYISQKEYESIVADNIEIIKLLVAITKSLKTKDKM